MDKVFIYKKGPLSCSVCASENMTGDEVAAGVNKQYLCGTEHGWQISKDETFASGDPNPCQCNEYSDRKHWFLDC